MKTKDVLSGIGGSLVFVVMLLLSVAIGCLFIFGAAWASTRLLPWCSFLTRIGFGLVIFVFLPLAIPRATRGFSSIALFIVSFVFGATLWMEGFLFTLSIWGVGAVFVGLFMFGVGVVPIAMLATLLKGMWWALIELVLLTIATFATRLGALSLSGTLEE